MTYAPLQRTYSRNGNNDFFLRKTGIFVQMEKHCKKDDRVS